MVHMLVLGWYRLAISHNIDSIPSVSKSANKDIKKIAGQEGAGTAGVVERVVLFRMLCFR